MCVVAGWRLVLVVVIGLRRNVRVVVADAGVAVSVVGVGYNYPAAVGVVPVVPVHSVGTPTPILHSIGVHVIRIVIISTGVNIIIIELRPLAAVTHAHAAVAFFTFVNGFFPAALLVILFIYPYILSRRAGRRKVNIIRRLPGFVYRCAGDEGSAENEKG